MLYTRDTLAIVEYDRLILFEYRLITILRETQYIVTRNIHDFIHDSKNVEYFFVCQRVLVEIPSLLNMESRVKSFGTNVFLFET